MGPHPAAAVRPDVRDGVAGRHRDDRAGRRIRADEHELLGRLPALEGVGERSPSRAVEFLGRVDRCGLVLVDRRLGAARDHEQTTCDRTEAVAPRDRLALRRHLAIAALRGPFPRVANRIARLPRWLTTRADQESSAFGVPHGRRVEPRRVGLLPLVAVDRFTVSTGAIKSVALQAELVRSIDLARPRRDRRANARDLRAIPRRDLVPVPRHEHTRTAGHDVAHRPGVEHERLERILAEHGERFGRAEHDPAGAWMRCAEDRATIRIADLERG